MRLNQFIAQATTMSRRAADTVISQGRVTINEQLAHLGDQVKPDDIVILDDTPLKRNEIQTIMLHKPVGYICSHDGQGSKTIYDLLPDSLHHLQPIGRLDKDSSGLLLLTNDGKLAQQLSHPSFTKFKVYEVTLDKVLSNNAQQQIEEGLRLEDGVSKLALQMLGNRREWQVTMHEGRNRQIRRTFAATGRSVKKLHRTTFDQFTLANLPPGKYIPIDL